jgi:hypothetical protein
VGEMLFRKYVKHLFLAVFSIIVLTPLFWIDLHSEYSEENRRLAVRPRLPGFSASVQELRSFTSGIESWLNDRIGFRRRLVNIYGVLHIYALRTPPHRQLMLGKEGHAFLASHENGDSNFNSFTKEVLGLPFMDDHTPALISEQMIESKRLAASYGDMPTVVVVIPQKQLLDYAYLPHYVKKFVDPENLERPLEIRVKGNLSSDISEWILYPYKEALHQNALSPLYPKQSFHWVPGRYTALMAAKIADYFGLAVYESPVPEEYEARDNRSDLSHFAGFGLHDFIYMGHKEGVLAELGVKSAVLTDKYASLTDVTGSYWVNTNIEGKKKLLWLGDSFSWAISADLSRYFNEVFCIDAWAWMTRANAANQDIKALVKQLMSIYQPDYIVFSRHTISGLDYLFKQIIDTD